MRIKLMALVIAALLLGSALYYNQGHTPENVAVTVPAPTQTGHFAPFPVLAFKTPDGDILRVQDLKEPTILVHFWAAWCAPCRAEFPALLKYVNSAHGKIALLAVSLDSDYANSARMLRDIEAQGVGTSTPHLYWAWDENKSISLKHFNTVKVPETIIVNDKREMVDKIVGEGPWAEASVRQ